MIIQIIRWLTNKLSQALRNSEAGQAIVELMLVVLLCLMIGIGIYETGAFLHNISVINQAVNNAAIYASWGAPISKIKATLVRETDNLLAGAFLAQKVSKQGVIVEVRNPKTDQMIAPLPGMAFPFADHTELSPGKKNVAEYIFWAQRYEIRVGIVYRIGIYIPFLGPITATNPIVGSHTIQAPNDMDRDGLADSREAEYVLYYLDQTSDTPWVHPMHRDGTGQLDTAGNADPDGDGTSLGNDNFPYDFDNDGVEDKFDHGDNRLNQNPVVGP